MSDATKMRILMETITESKNSKFLSEVKSEKVDETKSQFDDNSGSGADSEKRDVEAKRRRAEIERGQKNPTFSLDRSKEKKKGLGKFFSMSETQDNKTSRRQQRLHYEDMEKPPVPEEWECGECGNTSIGILDDKCSRCGADENKFTAYHPQDWPTDDVSPDEFEMPEELGGLKIGQLVRLTNPKAVPRFKIVGFTADNKVTVIDTKVDNIPPKSFPLERIQRKNLV